MQNPTYYGLEGLDDTNINVYLTGIVDKALRTLNDCYCLEFDEDDRGISATTLGRIASYYYLSHLTVQHFSEHLSGRMDLAEVLQVKFMEIHNDPYQNSPKYDERPSKRQHFHFQVRKYSLKI